MSGAVEALRHLELMALNTAQTAAAASKVNECVALLTASLTTPPARSYADAIEDAAKVADDLASIAERGKLHPQPLPIDTNEAWRRVEDACRDISAAIRLLSQGGKA